VTAIVVPFAGLEGKTRLHASRRLRAELSLAMLGDVLAAAAAVGTPRLVTADAAGAELARGLGAEVVADPGGGQGAAVARALEGLPDEPALVVNADVPCALPADLRALLAAEPRGALALVEALDGTTNALRLPAPHLFAPLYGPGSADRFRAHAARLGMTATAVDLPNLAEDVDTIDDLSRLHLRLGPRSQERLAAIAVTSPA
jgi:2-phospho-L-lactate guanylyltransferase